MSRWRVRNHLEIHVVPVTDQAFIIDTSTSGTSWNGVRLERAVGVARTRSTRFSASPATLDRQLLELAAALELLLAS